MNKRYKKRDAEFKLMIALEAIKGEFTINQIASKYDVHPKQVTDWRDQLLCEGKLIFIPKTSMKKTKTNHEKDDLMKKIGHLTVEVEFLKKKMDL